MPEEMQVKPIPYVVVIAMECLKAIRLGQPVSIENISQIFLELCPKEERRKHRIIQRIRGCFSGAGSEKVFVESVALKLTPSGGVYSEDVAEHFGRLITMGFARRKTGDILELFNSVFSIYLKVLEEEQDENPQGLIALAKKLQFRLTDVLFASGENRKYREQERKFY